MKPPIEKCPRCEGQVFLDADEYYCLQCGWRSTQLPLPEAVKIRKIRDLPHFRKVSKKIPSIEQALGKGIGIRQAAREFGVAINTIRGIARNSNIAIQAQQTRRGKATELKGQEGELEK